MKKFIKHPITCSTTSSTFNIPRIGTLDWNKEYSVEESFSEWADSSDPSEIIEIMEDNGYGVAQPSTLKAACEIYHNENDDIDSALSAIDSDYGNSVGVFPLCQFTWTDQQKIYTKFIEQFYPNELN